MLRIIGGIIIVFVLSLNISVTSNLISMKKVKVNNIIEMFILIFIPSYGLHLLKFTVFLVPSSIIIGFIFYAIKLKNARAALLISISTQFIFVLCDSVIGLILVFAFKFSYFQIKNNEIIQIVLSLCIFTLSFAISEIIRKLIKNKHLIDFKNMNRENILIFSLCLIVSIFLVYTYTIMLNSLSIDTNKLATLLNFLLIVTFIALMIILTYFNIKNMKRQVEQKYMESELKQLEEYINMVEQVSRDLRGFKHDYINIINTIGSYLDSKSYIELTEYYKNELMPESIKILNKDTHFMLLQYIKINPLKGLISSKIIIAQSKGIITKISINEDIDNLSISVLDICRIIGILLDNAIEAAETCDEGFIELVILKNHNTVTFVIKNSCPEDTPPVYKIYEKNFSTKGAGRGIGLKSVKNIIDEKYKNILLNTKIENSVFQQELVVFCTNN